MDRVALLSRTEIDFLSTHLFVWLFVCTPFRRALLATVGSAAVVGIAGCSGSESDGSNTVDCHTGALDHGDGNVLDGGARGTVEDGDVRLAVPLSVDDVRENDLNRIEVCDVADMLAYTIPVSTDDAGLMANKVGVSEGQLQYEQSLGHRPFHGQYRVVAVNTGDAIVDSVTIQFNCFSDVDNCLVGPVVSVYLLLSDELIRQKPFVELLHFISHIILDR